MGEQDSQPCSGVGLCPGQEQQAEGTDGQALPALGLNSVPSRLACPAGACDPAGQSLAWRVRVDGL